MELEKDNLINEYCIGRMTNEEFIKRYDAIGKFKVATKDSCEVLEVPDAYDDYYRDANGVTKDYFDAMVIWNKAPSISKDRLELNKLMVENERLNKVIIEVRPKHDAYNRACKQLGIENNILGYVTEANKQLKEYKEVVKNVESALNDTPFDYWDRIVTALKELSKLNKD